jgi:hypothetical protein
LVEGFAGKVKLRSEQRSVAALHFHVNVSCAMNKELLVVGRLDRLDTIGPVTIRKLVPTELEAVVVIHAIPVAAPDVEDCPGDRTTVCRQYATLDDQRYAGGIRFTQYCSERSYRRIEGSFGLRNRSDVVATSRRVWEDVRASGVWKLIVQWSIWVSPSPKARQPDSTQSENSASCLQHSPS